MHGFFTATMDNYQFYPTPPALAERMWRMFECHAFRRVLDPSAGEGDLLEAFPSEWKYMLQHVTKDVCEIDISRHPVLRSKGYPIVGLDFLDMADGAIWSHVLINPPFAEGDKHVLHAWRILYEGEIVAQINAETLRNPHTATRRELVALIEQHGRVEFVEDAYSGADARINAKVDVALIYLRKRADEMELLSGLLDGLTEDASNDDSLAKGYDGFQELALPKTSIETSVALFNSAVRAMREAVRAEARAQYTADLIGQTMAVLNGQSGAKKGEHSVNFVGSEMGKRYLVLKDRAWAQLLRSTSVTDRLSSKAQKRVESEFEHICRLEFTVKNIYAFLQGILDSQTQLQIEMACDIFDEITRYWSDNTAFYRGYGYGHGWKSNDKHRLCGRRIRHTRFILPGFGRTFGGQLDWDGMRRLADFDKVFAMLDGKVEPEVSIASLFSKNAWELKQGERLSATYFDVRWYPGVGTVHFFPRSQETVDRLNRMVGRHRMWLPPDDSQANADFWKQYDKAERLNKDLTQELRGSDNRSYSRSLFHDLESRDDDCRQRAEYLIDKAQSRVHQKHEIDIEGLIETTTTNQQPLLLAA